MNKDLVYLFGPLSDLPSIIFLFATIKKKSEKNSIVYFFACLLLLFISVENDSRVKVINTLIGPSSVYGDTTPLHLPSHQEECYTLKLSLAIST